MPFGLSRTEIAIAVATFVGSTLVSTGIVAWFLVGIRPDYFVADTRGVARKFSSPTVRALFAAGKNLLGGLLVIVGLLLSLPGVPGQGLLTIFVGIVLMDIPGKRRIELAIVRRNAIRRNIDRLRKRFGRAPLQIETPDAAPDPAEITPGKKR